MIQSTSHSGCPMSWKWNLERIIGADAADPKPSHFAMGHTQGPNIPLLKSKSRRKNEWPGVDVSTRINSLFVMEPTQGLTNNTSLAPSTAPKSRGIIRFISTSSSSGYGHGKIPGNRGYSPWKIPMKGYCIRDTRFYRIRVLPS